MATKYDIRRKIVDFALKGFDHDGAQALPLRPDVFDYAAYRLFIHGGSLDADLLAAAPEPDVLLNQDGTVELHFVGEGGKELLLTIQCFPIVTWMKVLEDGQTLIEGKHNQAADQELTELNRLIEWIGS